MTKIIFFIMFCGINISHSQNIETKTGLKNAASVYGYLIGQEYALNKIKKDYSDLTPQVVYTELMFKNSFGKAKENIETLISSKFSNQELESFKAKVIEGFLGLNINIINSEDEALAFIEEVKSRSKGKIESPIKEFLFFYAFYFSPDEEFAQGYVQDFKTDKHVKAKATNWSIKVPASWVAQEAERPNIIKKFISEGGYGNESIMLMVKDLGNIKLSKSDIANFFTEKEMKDMISGSKFLSFHKMTFDGINGGVVKFENVNKRLDFEIFTEVSQYMFIFNNKLYTLYCSVGSPLKDDLAQMGVKFEKLFKLVANSIVINEQYKN